MFKNSEALKRASYWTFVIIALITIAVYYSSTQAEALVERLLGVREELIHEHREVANWSLSLVGLLFLRSKKAINSFVVIILLVAIAATGLVSWTGLQGGIIRHSEVRKA